LIKAKFDEKWHSIISLQKSLCCFSLSCGMSEGSAHAKTQFLRPKPQKTTAAKSHACEACLVVKQSLEKQII
jgi:hypothetical protein